ncbi:anti-sigma E factor [Klebsiella pneumoniae]|uniref:Anti-sigma E factor n=1 Tax=Klebsiella pneumoniae TaxID=573 RepID=A0A4P0YDA2_KLEPN|nr:anti-sigma E factor [Klebsiella pneumoniae]
MSCLLLASANKALSRCAIVTPRLNNQPLAQLLQLDGPRREVVLRGTEISYFEPGLDPFTLNGDYIVDSLPSLVYSDFKRLSASYDFISVGRTRIADRLCDVIRVVARDGTRYSFIAWLDAETKLPLRVDLLDRDGGNAGAVPGRLLQRWR